jgi:hypothetical protein
MFRPVQHFAGGIRFIALILGGANPANPADQVPAAATGAVMATRVAVTRTVAGAVTDTSTDTVTGAVTGYTRSPGVNGADARARRC